MHVKVINRFTHVAAAIISMGAAFGMHTLYLHPDLDSIEENFNMNCYYLHVLRMLLRFGSIGLHISVNGQECPEHYLEHVDNLYLFVYVITNLDPPPPPLFIPSSQYLLFKIFGPLGP